jgi:hypothetical protein
MPQDRKPLPDTTSGAEVHELAPQLAPEGAETPLDADLARVAAAWPDLPPHIKAAVLALVGTAR